MRHQLRAQLRTARSAERALSCGFRTVPEHIIRPPYAATGLVAPSPPYVVLQSPEEVDGLRRAGQTARRALEYACSLVEVAVYPSLASAEPSSCN